MEKIIEKLRGDRLNGTKLPSNVKKSDYLFKTNDLSIFKLMPKGNRDINKKHVTELVSRFNNKLLRVILYVNEKLEIIDGQHSYSAISIINKRRVKDGLSPIDVEFVICNGYGTEECCEYNGKGKNWSNTDTVKSAVGLGIKNYKIYNDMLEKYNLSHNVVIGILTGNPSDSKYNSDFKNLKLKIPNIEKSKITADRIIDIVNTGIIPIGQKNKPASIFGLGLLEIFKIKGYDHQKMIRKCIEYVENNDKPLRKLTNITETLIELDILYNVRERKKLPFITEKRRFNFLLKTARNK